MARRSPEALAHSRRIREGGYFEDYSVPEALRADGYRVMAADKSRGLFDHFTIKRGQLLVIQARLTPLRAANRTLKSRRVGRALGVRPRQRTRHGDRAACRDRQHAAAPGKALPVRQARTRPTPLPAPHRPPGRRNTPGPLGAVAPRPGPGGGMSHSDETAALVVSPRPHQRAALTTFRRAARAQAAEDPGRRGARAPRLAQPSA